MGATLCWVSLSSTPCVLLTSCMASPPTAPIRYVMALVPSETQACVKLMSNLVNGLKEKLCLLTYLLTVTTYL